MAVAEVKIDYARRELLAALERFIDWLSRYGETSWDHQSFFAGPLGRQAKALYYRNRLVGTFAVAPMIFCEAFAPGGRRLFASPVRFPIADAHYAMGFFYLYSGTSDRQYFDRGVHFLDELEKSRCPGYRDYCWGYPFDWETRNGRIKKNTPLITTTPYVYEAFLAGYEIEQRGEWLAILESIARHALEGIKDFKVSEKASSCSYTPHDKGGVINAAAYRAFLLTSAWDLFSEEEYIEKAERNLYFVLENQNADGSWAYALDGVRDFVDHFHTCFVLKSLVKIQRLRPLPDCEDAIKRGITYYVENLLDEQALPRPFSRAPRLTVYKRELYDYAECINLCWLLKDRFPALEQILSLVSTDVLERWQKPDGSFRSRELHFGWDNTPMHRWAQSQMFRSLSLVASSQ